jgi:hypothetical protein
VNLKNILGQIQAEAIGKWTIKMLALTDALGNLLRFVLLPGQRYDTVGVAPLISNLEFDALIADKAFDSNWITDELRDFHLTGEEVRNEPVPYRACGLEGI